MAAATQVFDTTELLEAILYQLPMRDLLFAQKISKQWKAVIGESIKLQQALFFKPISTEVITVKSSTHMPFKSSTPTTSKKGTEDVNLLRNPLLEPIFSFMDAAFFEYVGDMEREMRRQSMPTSWLAPNASYKRMLATQPLVQNCFSLHAISYDFEGEEWKKKRTVSRYEKCMGEVMKAIDSTIPSIWGSWDGNEDCSIWIEFAQSFSQAKSLQSNTQLNELINEYKEEQNSAKQKAK